MFLYTCILVLVLPTGRTAAFSPLQRLQTTPISAPSSASRLYMATWSDSRAVQEYKDFLASGQQEITKTPDCASVIVRPADGPCELADALFAMGMGNDVVLTPNQDLPSDIHGATVYPIYICVPPTQLKDFLVSLPDSFRARRDDFVFLSGGLTYGNIEGILKTYGYCRDTMTQMLVTGLQLQPRIDDLSVNLGPDAQGETKWAGECAACGKWQGSIEERLARYNVRCRLGFYREWRRLMVSSSMKTMLWERLLLILFHVSLYLICSGSAVL